MDLEAPTVQQMAALQAHTRQDRIADHNLDKDDRQKLSTKEMNKLERYSRFEKRFPFYLMDVNGYVMHLKEAMKAFLPDTDFKDIKNIDLSSLQGAFKNFKSWDDLND